MDEVSLFSALKGLNINKILNTASKTINFVNKAIPVYKEMKPTIGNIKKAFVEKDKPKDIVDEIKSSRPIKTKKVVSANTTNRESFNDTLTFFQ